MEKPSPYTIPGIDFTEEQIITIWEDHYGLALEEVRVQSRKAKFKIPRQVLMFLLREFGKLSYAQAGEKVDRTHATAMHAYKKVTETYLNDRQLRPGIERLLSRFSEHYLHTIQVQLSREDLFRLLPNLKEEQRGWNLQALWRLYQESR